MALSGSLHAGALTAGSVALLTASGRPALRYGALRASDDRGRNLPARMVVVDGQLVLSIDDRGARYPVRVDPLVQQAKLTSGTSAEEVGSSLAMSGDTIVAGAPNHTGLGKLYVFVRPAGGWADASAFTARLGDASESSGDVLGKSVAISGDTIVAGAQGSGYADVFVRPPGGWATTSTPAAQLTDSAISGNTGFGSSVAVSGDTVVVGDPADGGAIGGAYVYVKPAGGWANATLPNASLFASSPTSGQQLGQSVAIAGDTIVAGAGGWRDSSNVQTGAVFVFVRPASGWGTGNGSLHQTAILSGTNVPATSFVGQSVAFDGTTVVGGAPQWQVGGNQVGAALVWTKPSGGWVDATDDAVLTASDGANNDDLGTSVALAGSTVVAGSPGRFFPSRGALYVFDKPSTGWADAHRGPEADRLGHQLAARDRGRRCPRGIRRRL